MKNMLKIKFRQESKIPLPFFVLCGIIGVTKHERG